ncbi:hypothetical protein QF026_002140 [Streptomyces aurantiacus]|nr:hypothetical protein [Streptomyces aurantiacus]MDQ0773674.1 hypothetical protein [Streptomyces aurantiacus]
MASTYMTSTSISTDFYSTFAKEGGRVGSGALGAGQGGVARCAW